MVLEHLCPLLEEPWVTDVVLFGLIQFSLAVGGDDEEAPGAGGIKGPVGFGTSNKKDVTK
jgi:hypothetical protein